MGSGDKPHAMEIRRSYGSAILAGRASSGVHQAALMLMLFVGPWTEVSGNQTFPDAESYWAGPIEIDGDAEGHHPLTYDLAPRACAVCHPLQYLDWRDSLHARAVSPGFLAQLDAISQGERRRCFSCHVPPAERQEEWVARGLDAGPDLHGVDCASCHVRGRQRFGPRERSVSLHGVVAGADFFRESEFCAPCHQFGPNDTTVNGKPLENTLQEWSASRYAREGQTCQSCHMPDGSHRFAGIHDPPMTASALRVTAIRGLDGIAVELVNARAGHALPTYSVPRIRVRVSSPTRPPLDYTIQRRMDWDAEQGWRELSDTRLMPGEVLPLSYPLAERAAAEVVVWVDPDADYFERVYPAMMEMLAGEVSLEEWDLLQEARRRAGESSYQLLRLTCEPYLREPVPCRADGPSFRNAPIAAELENGPSPRGSADALREDSG
jgi:hypothetical protein